MSGKVVSNGDALAGVSILVGGEEKAVTDESGAYTLSGVTGKITISSRIEGYKTEPAELTVGAARSDADFNAYLIETEPEPEPEPEPDVDETKIAAPTDGSLYDDFDKGISAKGKWDIVNKKWGAAEFNGVTASNVGYTTDGSLILRSKGLNYPNASERATGACIVSKEALGPGKFEIAAKVSPRLGMCSAIWTFYYEDEATNHEIDIEFPGRPSGGDLADKGFDYLLNTNWTSTSAYHTDYVKLADKGLAPANDGKWHKYGFEWSVKDSKVKYYIDDVLTAEITQHIPKYKGQLWIGVWEPVGWAGSPDYEVSDMLVDWVGYTSYNETAEDGVLEPKPEFLEKKVASASSFPTAPQKVANHDYISNGSFSGVESAWTKSGASDKGSHIISLDYLGSDYAYRLKNNSSISQKIFAVYEGYRFDFKASGQVVSAGADGSLKVTITFTDNKSANAVGEVIEHTFTSAEAFEEYAARLTVPAGAKNMTVTFTSAGDGLVGHVDNVSLLRVSD